jgi:hypothetical protein
LNKSGKLERRSEQGENVPCPVASLGFRMAACGAGAGGQAGGRSECRLGARRRGLRERRELKGKCEIIQIHGRMLWSRGKG